MRSLAQTLGSAAIGLGLGLGVLVLGFVVSRMTLPENGVAVAAVTLAPSASARSASPTAQATAAASPTVARTAAPTPVPLATPDPMIVTAFRGQDLSLAALTIPAGYTVASPIAGTITIEVYQFVDGQIRTGVDGQPSYPYVFVKSADRVVKLRPGLIGKDVQVLVKDGDTVAAGTPLFKTLTTGASSWATFYDSGVTAQVVVSASNPATGVGIDPVPLFRH
jgi:biotin carboxyl carrier protein